MRLENYIQHYNFTFEKNCFYNRHSLNKVH